MRSRVAVLAVCLVMLGCAAEPRPAASTPSPSGTPAVPVPSASGTSAVPTPSPSATPTVKFSDRWVRVPGLPNDDEWERGLRDVSAAGPEPAWAVGYTGWEDGVATSLRVWDGSRWRAVPVRGGLGGLASIDSDGPRNAWMVGGGFYGSSVVQHWDGHAWRRHRVRGYVRDVAVDGRRTVVISDTAVLTWNGAAFVTERTLGDDETRLLAVDTGAGHTWVTGIRGDRPVIWHGYGGRYEKTVLPKGSLNAILQIGPDDVWAVGGADERPLALHWDGRSWRRPAIPPWKGDLKSVTAFGPDDVWFAGEDRDAPAWIEGDASGGDDDYDEPGGISVLHWDGRSWTRERPRVRAAHHAVIERIPGTSRLWLTVNVENGDSESIVTFRRE
ncbi:hypothetical protein [Streptosporangium sandarakinum]|uniref:hypothetical protein n=1 Tax=Streptosporangium sandarakinum TaxID=1260955 RepID=UPI0037A337A1